MHLSQSSHNEIQTFVHASLGNGCAGSKTDRCGRRFVTSLKVVLNPPYAFQEYLHVGCSELHDPVVRKNRMI